MTSFDQPDAGLLVEHLLPSLLGTSYELSQDVHARTLFFGELGTTLEALHGRLTAISSRPRKPREEQPYPWLWRYVSHFRVGEPQNAVQHAKLWAFHWRVGDQDHLELHVSSTNLTTSAFKDQVQAGWQVMLALGEHASQKRQSWGELISFLDALAVSTGDLAAPRIQRLIALLGRVERPKEVTFVASIPGQRGAARQLAQFKPSKLDVLTPTIGDWSDRTLSAWSADVGVVPHKIHLKWIAEDHPWAATSGWRLSTAASGTLERSGVQLECLPSDARFSDQHREADSRWSHAKLYLLRNKQKRWLLLTSANWSIAAWGAGKTPPRNFELGVTFRSDWTDLEALGDPFDPPDTVPFCIDSTDEERSSPLEWAEASWDGRLILVRARSTDSQTPIRVLVTFAGGPDQGITLVEGVIALPWEDAERPPLTARLLQGTEVLEVDVLDLRPPAEFARTPLPEVDPAIARALREAFLLQRYGGPVTDAESIAGLGSERRPAGLAGPAADYAVAAWSDARAAFNVVDQWRAALAEAESEPVRYERVRQDGEELRTIYARRGSPAAGLAAEELGWRLDEEA